jgi:hypothetical protein
VSVTGISPNGKILGGDTLNELGLPEGWVTKLP